MVLLGIRTALKDDLHCSAAKLMYGTTLRLLAEFFYSSKTDCIDPVSYVKRLKLTMQQPQATSTCYHFHRRVHISDDLFQCMHIFMWHDITRKPLQQPYDGPYRVVKHIDKMFTIEVNGQQEVVSLNGLKPFHMDKAASVEAVPTYSTMLLKSSVHPATTSTRTTCSGRHVHWPERFTYWSFTTCSLEGDWYSGAYRVASLSPVIN